MATVQDRILAAVEMNENGCWIWKRATQSRGYGSLGVDGKTQLAHRAAYTAWKGEPPAGHQIDHQCHNRDETCAGGNTCQHRKCVNPEHLEAVTGAVNNERGQSPAAVNGRRTHCKQGHPFDLLNTYVKPSGKRQCRACHSVQDKRWRTRVREAATT